MDKLVSFRDFEERDIDFVLQCKNDDKLNSMVVGHVPKFDRQKATEWVHGCMKDDPKYKFWAVCTNDEEQRIIGWTAISQIDTNNHSAHYYSIVIGDNKYRVGIPWIEIQQFVISYVFDTLDINRLSYACLTEHPSSMAIGPVWFFEQEGIKRQAIYKRERYYDVAEFALLKEDYLIHRDRGEYEFSALLSRYANFLKKKK